MERKCLVGILVVFVICMATRIFYVHEKSILEGDELTSLTLAYNNTGWGDNQTCAILQSTEEINAVCECSDGTTYVFGASFPELKAMPCFKSSYAFNPWQDIYEYQPSAI